MRVTEQDVACIPVGNLRVRCEEFAAVWAAAEARDDGRDWFVAGVVVTCRWLAGATVRTSIGRSYIASSPVTRHDSTAYEELVEAEYLAAENLDQRRPDLLRSRQDWRVSADIGRPLRSAPPPEAARRGRIRRGTTHPGRTDRFRRPSTEAAVCSSSTSVTHPWS